jgi:hypothetical protein
MFDCESCGCEIYFNEAGTDNASEGMCYDCYNRREISIDNIISNVSKIDKVPLSKHYQEAEDKVMQYFMDFYGYDRDNYANTPTQLQKSGGGYGKGYGFYNTSLEISSNTLKEMKNHIYTMLKSRIMISDHRKYGLYHAVQEIFAEALDFYDANSGEIVNGSAIDLAQRGREWTRFSLENVNANKIYEMITADIKDGGGEIRARLIKIINGSAGNRAKALFSNNHQFWENFEQYKTNSAVIKLPIKIGFDPDILHDMLKHNHRVNSCQVEGNNESYAFANMDLVTNPHLLALVFDTDGKTLIGRSLIRFFKQNEDDTDITYVAPSRLYLSNYTHAKSEIYNEVFAAVDEWAAINFGDKYKLIAYGRSNHDSPVVDFLNRDKFKIKARDVNPPASLITNWWHTWFQEKPDNNEAKFVYYQDEVLDTQFIRITDAKKRHQQYAARESLYRQHYNIVEVRTQNEQ